VRCRKPKQRGRVEKSRVMRNVRMRGGVLLGEIEGICYASVYGKGWWWVLWTP